MALGKNSIESDTKKKIFLFSGHMIDSPDRKSPRFPENMADLAGRIIAMKLDECDANKGDLAYCGGACGGDILFAEACLEKGLKLEIYLPLPEKKFLEASVSFAGQSWVDRFNKMKNHPNTHISMLPENYRSDEGLNVFARNNLLQLEIACKDKTKHVQFIALWNGQAGDGAGGTQHMVETIQENKGSIYILKPQTMKLIERIKSPGPKRILALDGGGIKGAITLGYLEKIEKILKERHGNNPDFRLRDYFDLIGGTSTGAIIAAGLAIGKSAAEIKELYLELGKNIFAKKRKFYFPWQTRKFLKAKFDAQPLEDQLKEVFNDRTLGDPSITTGLCVVAKRVDTQSVWPLHNNPEGKYYDDNKDIPLRQVVRASTAAPTYFIPELFPVDAKRKQIGAFVDGGVSMANNPAFQLFLVSTLKGFRFNWKTGEDNLMIVSVGTGMSSKKKDPRKVARHWLKHWAVEIPEMLMDDASWNNQILMQYLSNSPRAYKIDSEIGELEEDLIAANPTFHYLRYNVWLEQDALSELGLSKYVEKPGVESLHEMSNGQNVKPLADIGEKAAEEQIKEAHLPSAFDLKKV